MNLMVMENEIVTITSNEIASMTNKEHFTIMRDIRNMIENIGVEATNTDLYSSNYTDRKGEQRNNYTLTKKGAVLLITKYSDKMRFAVLNRLEELENTSKVPTTFVEAMKVATALAIENEKLEITKKSFNKLIHQKKRLYRISEIATEVHFRSAVALNKFLDEKGIQMKVNKTWTLRAKYNEQGYVEKKIVEGKFHNDGRPVYDMLWTEKGKLLIIDLIS